MATTKPTAKKSTRPSTATTSKRSASAAKKSTAKGASKTPEAGSTSATGKKSARPKKPAAQDPTYTRPDLREKIKHDVMAGDKGGRPGQWSARKAQLVAHEYEAEGGGYKGSRKESQKHLEQWTEERWRTQDGKPAQDGETMHRYLPDAAWKELTPEQRAATERKKEQGSRQGKQFVANTEKASKARQHAEAPKKSSRKRSA